MGLATDAEVALLCCDWVCLLGGRVACRLQDSVLPIVSGTVGFSCLFVTCHAVQVFCHVLAREQQSTAAQVHSIQQQLASHPIDVSTDQQSNSKAKAAPTTHKPPQKALVAKLALIAASLFPSEHVAVRVLRLVPLLYLLKHS